MNWLQNFTLPHQSSVFAGEVDSLFWFITWISTFFFVLIAGLIFYSMWKYKFRAGRRTPHIEHNTKLEITWTVVPSIILLVVFFWGFNGYIAGAVPPANAMEIQVNAKKWVWSFEYPDGTRSVNEIHVPVNRPVKLVMTSEDVIHDFFVPDMRVKKDVVPGRYTQVWFNPTEVGTHVVECAQYCGKGHSDMLAKVIVESQAQYENWLATGGEELQKMPLKELGAKVYEEKGCSTCHSLDGSKGNCPSWKGIWAGNNKMQDGRTMVVDENYVRKTMMEPGNMLLPGYDNIMPSFQGLLREREIKGVIEFIKAQK